LAGAQNTALGPVVSRRPADLLRSQYIRFDRLNYRDGLTKACWLFWIETILAAFRADEHTVGPQATDLPTASIRQPRRPSSPFQPLVDTLTNRELDVLELLALRLSNTEIAEKLFISVVTVKGHLHNIYGKLNVKKRREAVEKAETLGILTRR